MKILHVNDVASVGSLLVRASAGRDRLFHPRLRRDFDAGKLGAAKFALLRTGDVFALRRAWDREAFSNLHVHYGTFAYLAEAARLPYSLHVHGGEVHIHPEEGGLKGWLSSRGIDRARRIVVSTPDLLEPIRRIRADAIYIPNPMEVPTELPKDQGRTDPRMLMLSKMDYNKGWNEQLALMEALKAILPGMTFRFFERGTLPAEERTRLTARLLAIGGEIQPLISRDEFLKSLSSHDFAIGQLFLGALGMSEMEAMAAGVPTVTSVRAHVALGYHPPVIEPECAAEAIQRLWEAGFDKRLELGLKERTYIEKSHRPGASLAALEALIA